MITLTKMSKVAKSGVKIHKERKPYIYTKPYHKYTTHQRLLKMADMASDNGRCWWIRNFLINNHIKYDY
tara:strand:- start:14370 stop:14576 length:207 start_codon:yes stop_codon:yes gene_type:complete